MGGKLARTFQVKFPCLSLKILDGRSRTDDLPGLRFQALIERNNTGFIMRIESSQFFIKKVKLVLDKDSRCRVVKRPVLHGCTLAYQRMFAAPQRGCGLAKVIGFVESGTVLVANEVDPPEDVGEPVVLTKKRDLIDGRDDNGRDEAVDILVGDVHGKAFRRSAALGVSAAMFDQAKGGFIPDGRICVAERALENTLISRIYSMSDVALVELIVDAVRGHGAPDEITDAESCSFQTVLFSDDLGSGERAGKAL
jgi:hypothetical protein